MCSLNEIEHGLRGQREKISSVTHCSVKGSFSGLYGARWMIAKFKILIEQVRSSWSVEKSNRVILKHKLRKLIFDSCFSPFLVVWKGPMRLNSHCSDTAAGRKLYIKTLFYPCTTQYFKSFKKHVHIDFWHHKGDAPALRRPTDYILTLFWDQL